MDMKTIFKSGGGVSKLSRALGFKSHGHLLRWKRIPAELVVRVEGATGIPREILRPDLYIKNPLNSSGLLGTPASSASRRGSSRQERLEAFRVGSDAVNQHLDSLTKDIYDSSSGQDGEASTGEVATPPCHDTLAVGPG